MPQIEEKEKETEKEKEDKTEEVSEEKDEDDAPAPKRALIDHNVQYIYDKPNPAIPSLLDLKLDTVNLPASTAPPTYERERLRNGTGEPVAALTSPWQQSSTGPAQTVTPSPWAFGQAPQSLNEVTMNFRSNLNAAAFGPAAGGSNDWQNGGSTRKGDNFRDGRSRNGDGANGSSSRRPGSSTTSGDRTRRTGGRWGRRV